MNPVKEKYEHLDTEFTKDIELKLHIPLLRKIKSPLGAEKEIVYSSVGQTLFVVKELIHRANGEEEKSNFLYRGARERYETSKYKYGNQVHSFDKIFQTNARESGENQLSIFPEEERLKEHAFRFSSKNSVEKYFTEDLVDIRIEGKTVRTSPSCNSQKNVLYLGNGLTPFNDPYNIGEIINIRRGPHIRNKFQKGMGFMPQSIQLSGQVNSNFINDNNVLDQEYFERINITAEFKNNGNRWLLSKKVSEKGTYNRAFKNDSFFIEGRQASPADHNRTAKLRAAGACDAGRTRAVSQVYYNQKVETQELNFSYDHNNLLSEIIEDNFQTKVDQKLLSNTKAISGGIGNRDTKGDEVESATIELGIRTKSEIAQISGLIHTQTQSITQKRVRENFPLPQFLDLYTSVMHFDSSGNLLKKSIQNQKNGNVDVFTYLFDDLGRLIKESKNNENKGNYHYLSNTNFVSSKEIDNQIESCHINSLTGRKEKCSLPIGDLNYNYDRNDILIGIFGNGLLNGEVFSLNYEIEDRKGLRLIERKGPFEKEIRLGNDGRVLKISERLPGGKEKEQRFDYTAKGILVGSSVNNLTKSIKRSFYFGCTEENNTLLNEEWSLRNCDNFLHSKKEMYSNNFENLLSIEHQKKSLASINEDLYKGESTVISSNMGKIDGIEESFFWDRDIFGHIETFSLRNGEAFPMLFDDQNKVKIDENGSHYHYQNGKLVKIQAQYPSLLTHEVSYDGPLIKAIQLDSLGALEFEYDLDTPSSIQIFSPDYTMRFGYNDYGFPNSFQWGKNKASKFFEYGRVIRIEDLIENVSYDNYGAIESIRFSNKLSINFEYDPRGHLLKQRVINNNLENELAYSYDQLLRLKNFNINFEGEALKQSFTYQNEKLLITKENFSKRDRKLRLLNSGPIQLEYNSNVISTMGDDQLKVELFYNANGSLLGGCREGEKLSISSEHCWIKISDDHFVVFGKKVSLVRVQGVAAGVLIEGEFYPVLTDHRGGIISAFDHRSGEPLFLRHFDNWGNKQVKSYSQRGDEVEKLIVWDFSQLIHNPLLKSNNLLHGTFRSYSPIVGEWATIDPLFMKNPDSLIHQKGNWNPIQYASGDPINYIDPSGHKALPADIGANWSMEFAIQKNVNYQSSPAGKAEANRIAQVDIMIGKAMGALFVGTPITVGLMTFGGPALLVASIKYNNTMIGVGQYVARNPNFLSNTHDFVANLITGASSDAPTNLYGMTGATLNWAYGEIKDSLNTLDSGGLNPDNYSFGNYSFDSPKF